MKTGVVGCLSLVATPALSCIMIGPSGKTRLFNGFAWAAVAPIIAVAIAARVICFNIVLSLTWRCWGVGVRQRGFDETDLCRVDCNENIMLFILYFRKIE